MPEHSAGPTVEVITTESGFDGLEHAWRELHRESPNCSMFTSWEWMRCWWERFGREPRGGKEHELQIHVVRRENRIMLILPLYLQRSGPIAPRVLRFLSTGEQAGEVTYPEHLDLLARHEAVEESYEVLLESLLKDPGDRWDVIDLEILHPGSILATLSDRHPASLAAREIPHISPQSDLKDGLESYLATHSSSTRQTLKRILRQRSAAGVQFDCAGSASEALVFFDELVNLHQCRWKKDNLRGAFSSENIRQFHRTIIEQLHERRNVVLTRLSLHGNPVAVLYGFTARNIFEFYQSGIDTGDIGVKSPGILAHLLTMELLAGQGVVLYDFLSGESEYKRRLSTHERSTVELRLSHRNLRTVMSTGADLMNRAVRKVAHFAR